MNQSMTGEKTKDGEQGTGYADGDVSFLLNVQWCTSAAIYIGLQPSWNTWKITSMP